MRTRFLTICMVVASMAAIPQKGQAQGLLKKISKGIEKVNKSIDKASDKASVAAGLTVQQENGVLVTNPIAKHVDVELVGAYGVSTSENFGNVELVLKVTMKAPESSITFGGNMSSKVTIAFDQDGNSYKMVFPSVGHSYDVTEGLAVRVVLAGNDAFQKVRKTDMLPLIKLFTRIKHDNGYEGEIQFKNVPVAWDVEH